MPAYFRRSHPPFEHGSPGHKHISPGNQNQAGDRGRHTTINLDVDLAVAKA